jgi:hypothetical protein
MFVPQQTKRWRLPKVLPEVMAKVGFSKRYLLLCLLLLVTLSFAVREAPELLSLQDDVSNDGEVVEAHCPSLAAVQANDRHQPAPLQVSASPDWRGLFLIPTPAFPLHREAGRNLLYLISLQRE